MAQRHDAWLCRDGQSLETAAQLADGIEAVCARASDVDDDDPSSVATHNFARFRSVSGDAHVNAAHQQQRLRNDACIDIFINDHNRALHVTPPI